MYRFLLTILLCLNAASSAPQAKESDVTYVKIQPVVEDTPADSTNARESRIEKLPLTFPGNVTTTDRKEPDKKENEKQGEPLLENKSELSESLDQSETIQSETISDINGTEETDTTNDLSEIRLTDDLPESNTDNLSDTIPSETGQVDRRARNFDSVEITETTEVVTKYEGLIDHTIIEAPRTKALPKFIPKVPKSSYFPKPKVFHSYLGNHLDIVGKRMFRSRCSCQKIWNCPKLQITVPRCPNEYFLCCF